MRGKWKYCRIVMSMCNTVSIGICYVSFIRTGYVFLSKLIMGYHGMVSKWCKMKRSPQPIK